MVRANSTNTTPGPFPSKYCTLSKKLFLDTSIHYFSLACQAVIVPLLSSEKNLAHSSYKGSLCTEKNKERQIKLHKTKTLHLHSKENYQQWRNNLCNGRICLINGLFQNIWVTQQLDSRKIAIALENI